MSDPTVVGIPIGGAVADQQSTGVRDHSGGGHFGRRTGDADNVIVCAHLVGSR